MITDPHVEKKINVGERLIPVWFYGDPKNLPIIFIHGRFKGFSEYVGDLPPRYLNEKYYVCAFDLPGFGKSKELKLTHVQFLTEIISRFFGKKKVVLFGTSYGGLVALAYAKTNPDRITALIIAATPVYSGVLSLIHLVRIIPLINTKASFVQDFKLLTIKNLSNINIPSLLVYSTKDLFAPVFMGRKLKQMLSNSKLVIIHTRVHKMFLHRINETGILQEINNFLLSHLS